MQAVFEAMGDREKKVETSAEWVLKALHGEAIADIADLYDQAGSFEAYSRLAACMAHWVPLKHETAWSVCWRLR
jgi:hypothetical protein